MDKKSMKLIILQHKGWLCLVIIGTIGCAVSEVLKARLMQGIMDTAVTGSWDEFRWLIVLTVAFLFFMLGVNTFQCWASNRFESACMISVKRQWFSLISRKQLCDYNVEKSAEFISHFTADAAMLREGYFDNFLMVIYYVLTGIAATVSIFYVHYAFIIFIAVTCWIPPVINKLWKKRLTSAKILASEENGKFVSFIKEQLTGFETNKLFGLMKRMEDLFQKKNQQVEQTQYYAQMKDDNAENSSGTASVAIWIGNMLLGVALVMRGILSVGQVLNANQLLNNVTNPLYRISTCLIRMQSAEEVYVKICADMEAQGQQCIRGGQKIEDFSGEICFDEVGLSWGERTILRDVNLQFHKGGKYLIVGESGSGKSSLLKILLNIYGGYEGRVLIDGVSLQELDKDSLYRQLSVVSQDNFVFADTIYNNITMYQDYSKEEVARVLELSALSSLVDAHEAGLEFELEENGKNISGGERQRICFARALIRCPSILLLDEATSALDSETAYQLEKNVLSLDDTMVISVSHRCFADLKPQYDAVLLVENQKIAQMLS
ncbi:MAG: ABC transporter ATP-binding protein [Agathobacter sp.]|nr:ABC transporter ATP-binding protein [Agathobacter sp.]